MKRILSMLLALIILIPTTSFARESVLDKGAFVSREVKWRMAVTEPPPNEYLGESGWGCDSRCYVTDGIREASPDDADIYDGKHIYDKCTVALDIEMTCTKRMVTKTVGEVGYRRNVIYYFWDEDVKKRSFCILSYHKPNINSYATTEYTWFYYKDISEKPNLTLFERNMRSIAEAAWILYYGGEPYFNPNWCYRMFGTKEWTDVFERYGYTLDPDVNIETYRAKLRAERAKKGLI